MNVLVPLSPSVAHVLQGQAAQQGLPFEGYLAKILEKSVAPTSARREQTLVLKIQETGLPVEFWERYNALVERRRAETLSEAEHRKLLKLSQKVEAAHAVRMGYMVELAGLRGQSLEKIMADLGFPAHTYE